MHTDVWGLTQISSITSSHYYITFINDTTRKTWIYCIQNKFVVFGTLKKWKCLVEAETRKKLNCIISDNGGEYCSNILIGMIQSMEFLQRI